MEKNHIPRILYLSNVPVELTYAGATLIYRLLEFYPKEHLLIIQSTEINPNARISGVKYHIWKYKFLDRLKNTRFGKMFNAVLVANQFFTSSKQMRIVKSFQPDIILTISFGLMWLKAFKISEKLKLPLYLILHDEWLMTENYGIWQKYLSGEFKKMYCKAANRFCISQNMESYYFSLYGVHSKLLYPLRGKNDSLYLSKGIDKLSSKPIKFCYAGSMFTTDFTLMLDKIAGVIAKDGSELHIFSNIDRKTIQQYSNLKKEHVIFYELIPSSELINKMNKEMDIAILLNSFVHEEAFKYNFSSKLVDYTSAGLPVLIWGPATGGAVAWAISENYDAVLTTMEEAALAELIQEFRKVDRRIHWANEMSKLGQKRFSYEHNYDVFIQGINKGVIKG